MLSLVIALTCLLGSSYFWMFKFYCPFLNVTSEDVCCYIRNVKSLKTLLCLIMLGYRSLYYICTEVGMAEE